MARKNFATSLVATAPSPATSGTSLVVTAAEGSRFSSDDLPVYATAHPANEVPTLDNSEVVQITGVSTDTLTIVRAQKGTSAKSIDTTYRISEAIYSEDLSPPATLTVVAQTAHGLAVGDVVKSSGTDGEYDKAQADTAANAEVVGIVSAVLDVDNYTITTSGSITDAAVVPTETAGTVLFLSEATAGLLTTTEPTDLGYISKPVAIMTGSNESMIVTPLRGVEINEAAGLNPIISGETPTGLVNGSNTTFTVAEGSYISSTLEVWINGVYQKRVTHFTETTPSTGTFTMGDAPETDDVIQVSYRTTNTGTVAAETVGGYSPAGMQVQMQYSLYNAVATGTTLIPNDDSIPQNTEGTEFMSVSITPKSSTNLIVIEVVGWMSWSASGAFIYGALFQDSIASAIASSSALQATGTGSVSLTTRLVMVAGTISEITFKWRAGSSVAGTGTFNGQAAARKHGDIPKSSIIVTEVAA